MLGPLTAKGLRITVTDLVSAPYIAITLAMMRGFGVEVTRDGNVFTVPPGGYRATTYAVEPDASTASYFFAAAALTGRRITVPGLGTDALQGDLRFVDVLRRMGAEVRTTADSTTVRSGGTLSGLTVNMRDISDTMPTLAAIAPFASGPVRIEDVGNTRVKECDRLEACAQNLRRMGITVATGRDWIEIRPGTPAPPRSPPTATTASSCRSPSPDCGCRASPSTTPVAYGRRSPDSTRPSPNSRNPPADRAPGHPVCGTHCPRPQEMRQQWGA